MEHDITEHLGFLRGLAMQCETVVEFGFRGGESATAFLAGGTHLTSYDINWTREADVLRHMVPSRFTFRKQSSLVADILECDMLFIDSYHTGVQLASELARHHLKVSKWIVMHDTETFARVGQDKKTPGLMDAVEAFFHKHDDWRIMLHLPNNNGLTILRRG